MSIKSFNEFTDEIVNENDVYGAAGKTKFSRWLRNVNSRVKEEMGDTYYSKYYDDHNDPYKTAKMATNLIPNTIRLITGAGAAIADFFSKGDNKDSFSKLSKHEIAGKKREIIDKWETDNISNKKVTDADAERFYKSGVLKGKKYFGKEYDPANPKNKDEEMYTDYVNDVMERYHKKMGGNA